MRMELVVLERAKGGDDFDIGYLDGRPAVGRGGAWRLVDADAIIHNPFERLVWLLKHEHGVWECIHDMHWQDQYVDPPERWIQGEPDFIEGDAEG